MLNDPEQNTELKKDFNSAICVQKVKMLACPAVHISTRSYLRSSSTPGGTFMVCKPEREVLKETNILVSSFVLNTLDSVIHLLCTSHIVWRSNLLIAYVRVCL